MLNSRPYCRVCVNPRSTVRYRLRLRSGFEARNVALANRPAAGIIRMTVSGACCCRRRRSPSPTPASARCKGVSFDLRAGRSPRAGRARTAPASRTLIKIMTGAVARRCRHARRSAGRAGAAAWTPHSRARSASPPSTSSRRSFPHLTVAENIALALETRRRSGGGSTGGRGAARPRQLLDRVGASIASGPAGRHAEHARAADGRDRQGDRRRRAHR